MNFTFAWLILSFTLENLLAEWMNLVGPDPMEEVHV